MNLVDSSGWIHYFLNGSLIERYATFIQKPDSVITPTVVLYEVYKKIRQETDEQQAVMAASQMRKTQIIFLSDEMALAAADISVYYQLSMADAMIYATAQSYGARLITSDAAFKSLPDVTYIPSE